MSDLIERAEAIKALYKYSFVSKDVIEREIKAIPSADTDLGEYSDKLWKNAYERGKADRPQGEWIRDRYWSRGVGMGEEYGFFYKCSMCEHEVEGGYTRCGFNFCPYCGADMRKGADDEV